MLASAFAFGLAGCNQAANTAAAPATTEKAAEAEEVEFPEFAVSPAELVNHSVDDIVQSLRLNATAVQLGQKGLRRQLRELSWRGAGGQPHGTRAEPFGPRLAVLG